MTDTLNDIGQAVENMLEEIDAMTKKLFDDLSTAENIGIDWEAIARAENDLLQSLGIS